MFFAVKFINVQEDVWVFKEKNEDWEVKITPCVCVLVCVVLVICVYFYV